MAWLAFFVLGGKFRNTRALPLECASNGRSGGPVCKPFVKGRSLSLGNGTGVDYTPGCKFLVSDQKDGQPVQRVVIIAENIADVVYCRIMMVFRDFFQHGRKFHCFFSSSTRLCEMQERGQTNELGSAAYCCLYAGFAPAYAAVQPARIPAP